MNGLRARACRALVFLVASLSGLPALSPVAELVPTGHWAYDAMQILALDSGKATLASASPESYAELRVHFEDLDYEDLSASGRGLFRSLAAYLLESDPLFDSLAATADVRPRLSISARYIGSRDARFGFESVSDYNDAAPVASVPLSLGFSPFFHAYADFSVGEGYWASTEGNLSSNIPTTAKSFDMNVPSTAYLSAGNGFCTAVIGRGRLEMGRNLSGSMVLSDTADRLDFASLALFSPAIRLSLTPVELSPDRYAYFHDLSLRPFPFISISLTESSLVHSSLDVRYLNPAMIFHSYAGWRDDYGFDGDLSPVGTQFGLTAALVPHRGIRLYGQFVMNQFQTAYELEEFSGAASVIPNSLGGLAGFELLRPVGHGFFKASVEGLYANPWLYILDNHAISYYSARRELVAPTGYTQEEIAIWLGSPYGPDSIAAQASLEYLVIPAWKLGASYRFLCQGENGARFLKAASDSYYPKTIAEAQEITPTGDTKRQHAVSIYGSRIIAPSLEVAGKLGYSWLIGDRNVGSILASCSLTWNLR